MIHHLMERLWAYVISHNPELMESLTEDNNVTLYLEEKVNIIIPKMEKLFAEGQPDYAVAELCLNDLTEDLRPSRYDYILALLHEEYHLYYARFKQAGTLRHKTMCMVESCKAVFDNLDFKEENMESNLVYQSILVAMQQYLFAKEGNSANNNA